MKLAKIFWSAGSILVNFTIIIYIMLQSKAPAGLAERFQYLNDNWHLYAPHWKAEFLFMAMITIGALYFAIHFVNIAWVIVSIGQIILLFTYPVMLGGYQNTPFEIASMANQVATEVFLFGNVLFFTGILLIYLLDQLLMKWLKWLAIALSVIGLLVFIITYMGFISWKQAIVIGPMINILYLINAYYGFVIRD